MKKGVKKAAKKKTTRAKPAWVAVSGGFDPTHIGHVRMFKAARKLGDKLVVILNNDNWLKDKKGYAFMPEAERAELIREFPFVDKVVISSHGVKDADRSVSRDLAKIRPAIFANGGDRKALADIPEAATCKTHGIRMVFNVGGGKIQSSSWMVAGATKALSTGRQRR